MIPITDIQRQILDGLPLLPITRIGLRETRGLVLAEDVAASGDIPPFANSAMDGFAVIAADIVDAPVELLVTGVIAAGAMPEGAVTSGTAIKIMTGAPMPAGADTVVKVEDTQDIGGGRVLIVNGAPRGTAIRAAGSDVSDGTVVMRAGTRLDSPQLGLLATVGVAWPQVRKRPVVGLFSTGDELVPHETAALQPGFIRDSNRLTMRALVEEAGGIVVDYGIVPDREEVLRSVLGHAANTCDLVVTSGGVSMGDFDIVKSVLTEIGGVDFVKVAMQPGKPLGFGHLDGTPFFGLPGNPVSVFVSFLQFVRPAMFAMMGADYLYPPVVKAEMQSDRSTAPDKTVFLRGFAEQRQGRHTVEISGGQQSHMMMALSDANCLIVVPVGVGDVCVGDEVDVVMFGGRETRTRKEVLGG
ncbi:MAG: molybdopterin molybdotransferase MoeA [Actinobacteria bacterium]|nr:molybdopterin molybdotransferase MoeA [Actinomycetota bacterium]